MPDPHTVPETAFDYEKDMIHLDRSTLLCEDWDETRGAGFRLYKTSDAVGKHPPLYALSRYTRSINQQHGDMEETESILQLGELTIDPDIDASLPDIDYLKAHDALTDTAFPLSHTFNGVRRHYAETVENLIQHALETEFESPAPRVGGFDVALAGDTLSVYYEADQIAARLHNSYDGNADYWDPDDWHAVVNAVADYHDVDREHRTGVCRARISMGTPSEWRMAAVEHQHKGVFKHRPALAAVHALREEGVETQTDIAEILGTDQGNVSRQVAELDEWYDRAHWMSERLVETAPPRS